MAFMDQVNEMIYVSLLHGTVCMQSYNCCYYITGGMRSENLVQLFSSQTCIRFIEIQSTHSLYVQNGLKFLNEILIF